MQDLHKYTNICYVQALATQGCTVLIKPISTYIVNVYILQYIGILNLVSVASLTVATMHWMPISGNWFAGAKVGSNSSNGDKVGYSSKEKGGRKT